MPAPAADRHRWAEMLPRFSGQTGCRRLPVPVRCAADNSGIQPAALPSGHRLPAAVLKKDPWFSPLIVIGVARLAVIVIRRAVKKQTAGHAADQIEQQIHQQNGADDPEGIGSPVGLVLLGLLLEDTEEFLKGILTVGFTAGLIGMIGVVCFFLPFGVYMQLAGLFFLGLGCAPIYPSMLHSTPENFGKDVSQSIMGKQMASAYVGSTFMPPVVGFFVDNLTPKLFPVVLLLILVLMFFMTERLYKFSSKKLNSSK